MARERAHTRLHQTQSLLEDKAIDHGDLLELHFKSGPWVSLESGYSRGYAEQDVILMSAQRCTPRLPKRLKQHLLSTSVPDMRCSGDA